MSTYRCAGIQFSYNTAQAVSNSKFNQYTVKIIGKGIFLIVILKMDTFRITIDVNEGLTDNKELYHDRGIFELIIYRGAAEVDN